MRKSRQTFPAFLSYLSNIVFQDSSYIAEPSVKIDNNTTWYCLWHFNTEECNQEQQNHNQKNNYYALYYNYT